MKKDKINIIVFEGVDGAGKSTFNKVLENYFIQEEGINQLALSLQSTNGRAREVLMNRHVLFCRSLTEEDSAMCK
jgi:thymidylate kinase